MQEIDPKKAYWFVMGARSVNRETKICDAMTLKGLECFVPMRYEVKTVRRQRQETLVPAIKGLIFVHARKEEVELFMEKSTDGLFFRKTHQELFTKEKERGELIIVSEAKMKAFIDFVTEHEQTVNFYSPDDIVWQEGEKVRVTIGSELYEGEIIRIKGKRRKLFALHIPNVVYSTIELTPELMQSIERYTTDHEHRRPTLSPRRLTPSKMAKTEDRSAPRSKHLEKDKKLLFDTAWRVLFVLKSNGVMVSRAYHVARNEVERVMRRVAPYKGVTAALEGELTLAMFLGAMATGEDTEAATERMRAAIAKLIDSSMLKFRMRFYLAKLTDDQEEMARIMDTIGSWNLRKPQRKQEAFIKETKDIWEVKSEE